MIKTIHSKTSIIYILSVKDVNSYDNKSIVFTDILEAIVLSNECEKANIICTRNMKTVVLIDAHIEVTYLGDMYQIQVIKYI